MKAVAVITEPEQVRKILRHLVKIGRSPTWNYNFAYHLKDHHVKEFGAECLIFGRSDLQVFSPLTDAIREELKGVSFLKAILPAVDIDCSALKRAARLVLNRIGEQQP